MSKFNKDNFIFNTFIKLTSRTYPYGLEDSLVAEMKRVGIFPEDLKKDVHGNYFYEIGQSRTIFASHLDTATKVSSKVNHVFDGDIIKTDGTTVLGADDKAGVTIMLWMMNHKVPGLYYFFIGEEVGCIGSGLAAKSIGDFKGKYDRIISFDRRDVFSVITHQSWSRCCSNEFADELANQLNSAGVGLEYKKDDGGVYTDSAEFIDIIPECTNLSVGYYKEHTTTESQDIEHLRKLAEACLKVDWDNLPTVRDPKVTEYKSSSTTNYSSSNYYSNSNGYYGKKKKKKNKVRSWEKDERSKAYGYNDDWYDEYSEMTYHDFDELENIKVGKSNTTPGIESGRQYFDSGSGLEEIKPSIFGGSYYGWVMSKFTGKLTNSELEVVKEQYLDMESENDKQFYNYLIEYVNDDSL